MTRWSILLAMLLLISPAAHSASFRTEAESEAIVRDIAAKLRCPVCQSENILDSQSGTAREMVVMLREQLAQGRTEAEIIEFFRSRYGNYVMLSPPASGFGTLIWATPLFLLLAGGGAYLLLVRRSARASDRLGTASSTRDPLTEKALEDLEL